MSRIFRNILNFLNRNKISPFPLLLLIQIKNDLVIIEINGIGLGIDSKVVIHFRQENGDGGLLG